MRCKPSPRVVAAALAAVLAAAAAAEETALPPVANPATDSKPLVLTIGVNDIYCRKTACDCIGEIATRSYDGVLAALAKQHGITLELTYFMEVMDLDKAILARRFDGVLCKPWTALRHAKQSGANFTRVADVLDPDNHATMTGWIVVPATSPIQMLADLNGKRLVFGQPDSYEKHAAPLLLLAAAGVKPISGQYFSSCGENLDALMNGTVDAAVISSYALSASCAVDFAKPEDFRTIAKTAEMPLTSLLVDLKKVSPATTTRLQQALLTISGNHTPKDLCGKGFVAPLPWQPVAVSADITPKTPPPADP
jgi:ABC-type phosphate/phosphonate transport system substrate-binding protein